VCGRPEGGGSLQMVRIARTDQDTGQRNFRYPKRTLGAQTPLVTRQVMNGAIGGMNGGSA
jgi:hypothetical protein